MRRLAPTLIAILCGAALLVAPGACTDSGVTPTASTGPGSSGGASEDAAVLGDAGWLGKCSMYSDCASGSCQPTSDGGYCTKDCASDTDCPATALCVAPCPSCGGSSCFLRCTATSVCSDCRCPSTDRCMAGSGCVPKSDVGGFCADDSDCKSLNCNVNAHSCDVPIGAPCNATNCAYCETWSTGTSYCSRPCQNSDCTGYGGVCASVNLGPYMCNAKCKSYGDPSCGGTCSGLSNSSDIICSCDSNNCTVTHETVPVGSPCASNSDCKSGDCVSFNYATAGLCSQACSTDTDCGSGMACVVCAGCAAAAGLDGGTDAGGSGQCFPTCVNGATCFVPSRCNSLARAGGGGSVNVCDPHLAEGAMCSRTTDCTSGRCGAGGTCIPSSGIATGQPCTKSPGDCASGQCCNSNCC